MNNVFQALSDPTRREILRLLRKREMTAGEIAERFPLAKSTLSGHFNILKNAGLIVAEKNGTSIVYSLNVSVVEQTLAAVMELFDVGKQTKKGKIMKTFSLRRPNCRNGSSSPAMFSRCAAELAAAAPSANCRRTGISAAKCTVTASKFAVGLLHRCRLIVVSYGEFYLP